MVSTLELYVLGLISHKPMHGYKLAKFFMNIGIEAFFNIKKPSIYKTLSRLEDENYIEGEYKIEESKPPKKVYSITKQGEEYLREKLREFLFDSSTSIIEFWQALRFADNKLTKKEFINLLKTRKKQLEEHEENMKCKKEIAVEKGIIQKLPFYFEPLTEMGKKIHCIQKETIDKLIKLAKKPENSDIFIKEDEV